jgi:hypothetical protein
MPDKYSYKPGKKKKAVRQAVAAQAPVTAAPAAGAKSAAAPATATAVKPAAVATAAAAPAEGRNVARAGNLGAELRRVSVLAGVIVVVLVAASIALT